MFTYFWIAIAIFAVWLCAGMILAPFVGAAIKAVNTSGDCETDPLIDFRERA